MVDIDEKIKKQKDSIKKELKEQGFALELETYRALKQRGWFTFMQFSFANVQQGSQNRTFLEMIRDTLNTPQEPKFRTIDITSVKILTSKIPEINTGGLSLIIECKTRKDENWVFYTESIAENHAIRILLEGVKFVGGNPKEALETFSYGELSAFGSLIRSNIKKPKKFELVQKIRKTSHHSLTNMTRFALSHKSVFKPNNPDNIYNACCQVMEACSFYGKTDSETVSRMIDDGKPINYWRLYPVVVFAGDIWEASFDENQEIQLEKKAWITYLHPHKGELNSIDIVSFGSLNSYLDMLDKEFTLLENVLSNQEEI